MSSSQRRIFSCIEWSVSDFLYRIVQALNFKLWGYLHMPTLSVYMGGSAFDTQNCKSKTTSHAPMRLDSTKRKRRKKMNKHKLKKRRRRDRQKNK